MSNNPAMHREAFQLLCGDLVGHGMSRKTFSSRVVPDCVIKVEEEGGMFQNVVEWETWNRVRDTPIEKWFAPCRWISPSGSVLIMDRTVPAANYPDKMPAFLNDFKRTNFGLFNNRLVCHDYGHNMLFEHGMTKRMKKADWYDAN